VLVKHGVVVENTASEFPHFVAMTTLMIILSAWFVPWPRVTIACVYLSIGPAQSQRHFCMAFPRDCNCGCLKIVMHVTGCSVNILSGTAMSISHERPDLDSGFVLSGAGVLIDAKEH
jgi:hypothetical protein